MQEITNTRESILGRTKWKKYSDGGLKMQKKSGWQAQSFFECLWRGKDRNHQQQPKTCSFGFFKVQFFWSANFMIGMLFNFYWRFPKRTKQCLQIEGTRQGGAECEVQRWKKTSDNIHYFKWKMTNVKIHKTNHFRNNAISKKYPMEKLQNQEYCENCCTSSLMWRYNLKKNHHKMSIYLLHWFPHNLRKRKMIDFELEKTEMQKLKTCGFFAGECDVTKETSETSDRFIPLIGRPHSNVNFHLLLEYMVIQGTLTSNDSTRQCWWEDERGGWGE